MSAVPRPTAERLRRYDAVIRRLAARYTSLLPARFATSFADPTELSFVLRSRQESLRHALAHVRGRVQMTVRIVEAGTARRTAGAAGAGRVGGAGGERPVAPAVTGSVYLRARAAAAAREREVSGFEPIRNAVRRWIRDERVDRHARVASVYHLIPRGSAKSYRTAADRAANDTGIRTVISGPWPPYAFAGW
jgi:hypothetical protein